MGTIWRGTWRRGNREQSPQRAKTARRGPRQSPQRAKTARRGPQQSTSEPRPLARDPDSPPSEPRPLAGDPDREQGTGDRGQGTREQQGRWRGAICAVVFDWGRGGEFWDELYGAAGDGGSAAAVHSGGR